MKNFILFLITGVIILSGCGEKSSRKLIIEGKINGGEGKVIVLVELKIKETSKIDSVILKKNGSFKFRVPVKEDGFYLLKADQGNFISLVTGPGEHVNIEADYKNLSGTAKIEGSPASDLYHQFELITVSNLRRVDSLGKILLSSQSLENFPEIKNRLDSEYYGIVESHKKTVSDMVRQNTSSLASLLMINRWFGRNPVFEMEQDSSLFLSVDSALMLKFPGNSYVIDHHKKVKSLRERNQKRFLAEMKLAQGNIPPDIRLPDPAKQMHQLIDFKGKPLILCFWASDSDESLKSIEELSRFYNQTKQGKFEIFAVSLDGSRAQWEETIRAKKMNWVNVSDLLGITSPISERYNLTGEFPVFYLIDKEGKIAQKSSNSSEIIAALKKIW